MEGINIITYGNINQQQLMQLGKECIADAVLPILEDKFSDALDFPTNDSKITKDELNDIAKKIEALKEKDNRIHFDRYQRYDKSLAQSISSVFAKKGMDVDEIIESCFQDINPTILKLKARYQRPRPFQLAQIYKLKLFPFPSFSAHTPSYPSGHTLQAIIILTIIGNKYPESYRFCKQMMEDVGASRVYLGHHYKSDNDASVLIAREIMKLPEMAKKYNL